MSKLIEKVRYEGGFDISVDAKRNLLVSVCIDKQDFRLMLFPLNSSVIKNFVRTMVYKGHSVVCNYFVTLAYISYFHNFSKPS